MTPLEVSFRIQTPSWPSVSWRIRWIAQALHLSLVVLIGWHANASANAGQSIEWPSILYPSRTSAPYWIAELVVQNGIPMRVQGMDLQGSGENEQRFYREWLKSKQEYAQFELEGVPAFSARDGNFRIVVEFRPGKEPGKRQVRISSAWVYGVVPELIGERLRRETTLVLPLTTGVLSETYSFDSNVVNRTSVSENTLSLEANELYIREQAISSGWTVVSRRAFKGGLRAQVVLRRQGQEAIVALAQNGSNTSIVISNTLQTQ